MASCEVITTTLTRWSLFYILDGETGSTVLTESKLKPLEMQISLFDACDQRIQGETPLAMHCPRKKRAYLHNNKDICPFRGINLLSLNTVCCTEKS